MILHTIGKNRKVAWSLLFFFTITSIVVQSIDAAVKITIRLTNQSGNTLHQPIVSEPFICIVTISGIGSASYYPHVRGIQEFLIHTRPDVKRDDQKDLVHYFYRLRIDKPGTYTLGPAEVTDGRRRYFSDEITITVDTETVTDSTTSRTKKQNKRRSEPWAICTVDAQHYYIGQPVHCTVRAYFPHANKQLFQAAYPQIPDSFKKSVQQGSEPFEEIIDGQKYTGIRIFWTLYPEQSGKHMIPGCRVDFLLHERSQRSLGNFMSFMFESTRQETIHSNAVHIQVDELPPYTHHPVAGSIIGAVTAFSLSLDKHEISVGEGAVLTITIVGDSTLEQMQLFTCQAVPTTIRLYESKNTITPSKTDEGWVKQFEYVVQGIKPGEVTIPIQEIACFNPTTGTYQLARSNAVALKISGSSVISPQPEQSNQQNELDDKKLNGVDQQNDNEGIPTPLAPLATTGWYAEQSIPYPWQPFWFIFFLPIILFMTYHLIRLLRSYIQKHALIVRRKTAWYRAYWSIIRTEQRKEYVLLYQIMMRFIAHKVGTPEGYLTEDMIRTILKNKQNNPVFLLQWDTFIHTLAACAFYRPKQSIPTDLYKRTKEWITELEKIL